MSRWECITAQVLFLAMIQFFLKPLAFAKEPEIQVQQLTGEKSAYYLRVDLGDDDVRVLSPLVPLSSASVANRNPERMPQGFFLENYLVQYNAIAVSSGGYMSSYSPPMTLGFLKSNGMSVARPHNSWLTNGLFCSNADRAAIQLVGAEFEPPSFRDCLQAGPVLLRDGSPPPISANIGYAKLAQSVQEQTFICIDSQKRIVLGVTDKINFPALVEFLSSSRTGCVDALRLTGLDTAGLRDRKKLYGHDDYLFPSAIGVIPKRH